MKHVFFLYDEKNMKKKRKKKKLMKKKFVQDEVCIGGFPLIGGEGLCLHFQGV